MLDPTTVQLLCADLQDSTVALSATNSPAAIRRSTDTLTRVANILGVPVTLSMAPRPGGPGVIAELTEALPDAVVNIRSGPGCFDHPGTRDAIRATGRRVLAICGVTTEMVVLSAALDALAEGFEVYVVVDASGGLSARSEDAALRQIESAGGRSTSVASLVSEMVRDFTTERGREVISAIHRHATPVGEPKQT